MTDFTEKIMRVRIEFIDSILGSVANDKEIYTNFIGSKAPDAKTLAEEVEDVGVTDAVDKRTSVFLTDPDGRPYIANYVIKGQFKAAGKAIRRIPGKKYELSKMSAYVQKIEQLVHIYPRKIYLNPPEGMSLEDAITTFQRPLRASTPQGERISLKSSECMPEGTTAEFEIEFLDKTMEKAIRECLDYGRYMGLGEWRNAGHGQFEWMELKD